jgi:hypothetical protein
VLEREAQLAARLVEEAEIEVAAEVARRELDRLAQLELGLGEESRLEQDQAEVRAEDLGLGLSARSRRAAAAASL